MLTSVSTLGVAVIHYRTPDVALRSLARLREAAEDAAVVLVDTAPESSFENRLAREFPDVAFLPTPNHSYSHSVNAGLATLNTAYLSLMNADVLVQPGTLKQLVAVLEAHTEVGVAAPLALTEDGVPQEMGLPYRINYARLRRAERRSQAAGVPSDGPKGSSPASVPVSWLAGYMQLTRRSVWQQVGGYDESFRFFNEDLDFSLRVRELGFECRLVNTPVVHLGGTSTPDHPAFHVEGRRGGMAVTERHHGALYKLGHKAFLWAEALTGSVLERDPKRKLGHTKMLEMLRANDWSHSPFGDTLDQRW